MKQAPIAVVFGGTGFIGRSVVQFLAKEGYIVRVPTRNLEKANCLKLMGKVGQIIPFRASVRSDIAVSSAVLGADLVVNLIGSITQNKKNTFKTIHVEVAARLARISAIEKIKDFIHFSTIGADANSNIDFFKTKAMGEAAVKAFFPNAIIFRPNVVFGIKDIFINKVAVFMRYIPFVPLINKGKVKFQPIYVGDVAQAIVNACNLPNIKGKIFTLCGDKTYSFKEIILLIDRVTKRKHLIISVPNMFIYLKAFLLELWFWPPFTRYHLDLLKKDWVCSENEEKSIRFLSVNSPKSLETNCINYNDLL